MIEILEFVFASFWRWAGALLLLAALACFTPIRITINRGED